MRRNKDEKVLPPTRPNAGVTVAYRRKLCALIDAMTKSYARWLVAAYRANPPAMALDALPARELEKAMRDLAGRWESQFDEAAPALAKWFAQAAWKRSDKALMNILRKGGFSVRFQMTRAMRDILRATVEQNVSLIKSIPQQYSTEVTGLVMRSVQAGRDLGSLTKELKQRYAITDRRAAFIARDQNNKATSALQRARYVEMGIEEAIWQHSGGGNKPRKTHVANNGKRYNLATGWYDPDPRVRAFIHPGFLPSCRCTPRPVVKGFT